jgi:uncharacterized membrane protein YkvA (DUF1232 family)
MLDYLRLTWRLLLDRRVSFLNKLAPLLAVLYVLSPLDFLPDALPLLGVTDDLGVFILAVDFFIRSVPNEIVRQHLHELQNNLNAEMLRKRKNDELE